LAHGRRSVLSFTAHDDGERRKALALRRREEEETCRRSRIRVKARLVSELTRERAWQGWFHSNAHCSVGARASEHEKIKKKRRSGAP
jgi:hypothetical protein